MSSSDRDTAVRRPVTALPFRLHASVTCPPPAELARVAGVGARRPRRRPRRARPDARWRAAVLAEVEHDAGGAAARARRGRRDCATPAARRPDGELLIDRVLERGHGHPVLVAIVLAGDRPPRRPAGRHRRRRPRPLRRPPAPDRAARARPAHRPAASTPTTLGALRWQCGHQVAAELLDLLQPRYERDGDLTRALHVARLRCTLPFEDMGEAEQRLRRVTARLN